MSALAGIDIALWDLKGTNFVKMPIPPSDDYLARRLGVPIHQLLGGKVRNKIKVYAWIGGDRPSDIAAQASVAAPKDRNSGSRDIGKVGKPRASQQ
jgi:galactonate dehydratase